VNFLDLFQNPDGSFSSRRVFGIILLGVGIYGWYAGYNSTVATVVIGYGMLLLGVTTMDHRGP
jgi:hypothetical protein